MSNNYFDHVLYLIHPMYNEAYCVYKKWKGYVKLHNIQVEPGKPGAEVSKGKNYKPKKEFAYRMCTG